LSDEPTANYGKQSQLLGAPLRAAAAGTIAKSSTEAIGQSVREGLARGAISVGLQFATEDLDPVAGGLLSTTLLGALDGIISPPYERDANGQIKLDADDNPILRDANGDGILNQQDRKGIFQGIADSLERALGPLNGANPVQRAQMLSQMNNLSDVIRQQGLGAALEQYGASLLHRASIEALLNVDASVRQYGAIQKAIEEQLIWVETVGFEGREIAQVQFGNGDYLLLDPVTHEIIAQKQGEEFIRYTAPLKVDPNSGQVVVTEAEIEKEYQDAEGNTITSQATIQDGVVKGVTVKTANGLTYTVEADGLKSAQITKDGTIVDGILTDAETGAKLYFINGQLVKSQKLLSLIRQDPETGEFHLDPDSVEIVEALNPEEQLRALQIEIAHAIQNKVGPLEVEIIDGQYGRVLIDQLGNPVVYFGDQVAVLSGDFKIERLWGGVDQLVPSDLNLPQGPISVGKEMKALLQQQFVSDSDPRRDILTEYDGQIKNFSSDGVLPHIAGRQILHPPIRMKVKTPEGLEETITRYAYLSYDPEAGGVPKAILISDPGRGFRVRFFGQENFVERDDLKMYLYGSTDFKNYSEFSDGVSSPIEAESGSGTDFTLFSDNGGKLVGMIRVGVAAGNETGLVLTARVVGRHNDATIGIVERHTYTLSKGNGDDDGEEDRDKDGTTGKLSGLFGEGPIGGGTMSLGMGAARGFFMNSFEGSGLESQFADRFVGLIEEQAALKNIRIEWTP